MKALIFDLDDTLVAEKTSAEAAFLETCKFAMLCCDINPFMLYTAIRGTCKRLWHESPARAYCLRIGMSSREGLWTEFQGTDGNLEVLRDWVLSFRQNSWQEALRKCGVTDATLALELGKTYLRERRKRIIAYNDVVPILDYFKQSHGLGLLTNGAPDLQRRKIESSGLSDFFDEVIIAGEVGLGKPDVRIFELILSRLKVSPDAAVMIGNSLESDLKPAQTMGMKSVWINRAREWHDDAIVPDFEVSSLMELKDIFG